MLSLEILIKDLKDYDIQVSHADLISKINNIQFNSNQCYENSLFCCLKGVRNGHEFIQNAYDNGALCVLLSDMKYIVRDFKNRPKPYILVWNIEEFLIEYAKVARNKFTNQLIAIAGSVGKTTLKNFTVNILSDQNRNKVFYTRKSFNFLRSICAEMLLLSNEYKFAVIEVGIDMIDQMKILGIILRPDYILYSEICFEHLENFKNINNIIIEQKLLMNYMRILAIGPEILSENMCIGFNYIIVDENNTMIDSKNWLFKNMVLESRYNYAHLLTSPIHEEKKIISLSKILYLAYLLGIKVTDDHLKTIYNTHGRGAIIQVNNKKLYDYSYNAGSFSVISNIESISKTNEIDFIWGYMVELGDLEIEEHQKVINKFEENPNIRVFLYNIDPKKYKFKNIKNFIIWDEKYILDLRDNVYIQGSVINKLNYLVDQIIDTWNNNFAKP